MQQEDFGVERFDNEIVFTQLNKPKNVSNFLTLLKNGIAEGYDHFLLDFNLIKSFFPNVCVPIAGILDYYAEKDIDFEYKNIPALLEKTAVMSPLLVSENTETLKKNAINKIWRFENSSDIHSLSSAFIQELLKLDTFSNGVIESLEWCIYEVMDNVIQHSNVNRGYIMGQIHKKIEPKRIAFCIFDSGQGIYNSLKNSIHAPKTSLDAITLAVKQGVTRNKAIGQGNGLWGLHNIIIKNHGSLMITSDTSSLMITFDDVKKYTDIPCISQDNGCTSVDFQLDYEKPISIEEALEIEGRKHTNISLIFEEFENDKGMVIYQLSERSLGTGTRQAGERVRNEILNIYTKTKGQITIDFANITIVSSSYADELIGKLVVKFGFYGFNQYIRLVNMNELVQSIIYRSVTQRMYENLNNGNN